jgi:hypothetical protein
MEMEPMAPRMQTRRQWCERFMSLANDWVKSSRGILIMKKEWVKTFIVYPVLFVPVLVLTRSLSPFLFFVFCFLFDQIRMFEEHVEKLKDDNDRKSNIITAYASSQHVVPPSSSQPASPGKWWSPFRRVYYRHFVQTSTSTSTSISTPMLMLPLTVSHMIDWSIKSWGNSEKGTNSVGRDFVEEHATSERRQGSWGGNCTSHARKWISKEWRRRSIRMKKQEKHEKHEK